MMAARTVGILALQGAFAEHARLLESMGEKPFEIRSLADLERGMDALVLPGGESTAQAKLLKELGMMAPLKEAIESGLPTLGVCAGSILMAQRTDGFGDLGGLDAKQAEERTQVEGLRTFPCAIVRNAYGRQNASFVTRAQLAGAGEIPMTFIRAPKIASLSPDAETLAYLDGEPVAARWNSQIVATFHPELDGTTALHQLLLSL